MTKALYNEWDGYAAAWLRNLISRGLIADGDVAECSIVDLKPSDVQGYTQFHAFAGIGGWSLAARLAGWPDDKPLWTGSCPCQPFSEIGHKRGFDDPRHLWPTWFSLIRECQPPVVFGEQIANGHGLNWLDLVQTDMENANYAFAAADMCAASVGSHQARQRLFFVSHAASGETRFPQSRDSDSETKTRRTFDVSSTGRSACCYGKQDWNTEPGVCRVVDGISPLVAQVSAFGNAIVPQVAAEVIGAYLDSEFAAAPVLIR